MSYNADDVHHGQLLLERISTAAATVEEVAAELNIETDELVALFKHPEIKSALMAKVLSAIEIVRLKK